MLLEVCPVHNYLLPVNNFVVVQVVKVNDDHTVNDLRCHLEAVNPCKKAFTIELNGVKLDNLNQTLKEAGAIGALVQQAL